MTIILDGANGITTPSDVTIQSSGGGNFVLQPANSATDRTLTLPDEAGTIITSGSPTVLPKGGPAFSAYNSTGQTISTGTWTKATFDSEEFDTNNNFASSRFTPTVAGYYHIIYEVDAYGGGSNIYGVASVYKNGSAFKRGTAGIVTANQTESYLGISALVYLNGTTDYVEIYVNLTSAGTISLFGGSAVVGYFQGYLARAD